MKCLLAAAIVLLTPLTVAAQTAAREAGQTVLLGSPAFARLVFDKEVRVTLSDGTERRGVVSDISSTSMTIGKASAFVVPYTQVMKVVEAPHRARKGLWIGLASGAALGTVVCGVSVRHGPGAGTAGPCAILLPLYAGFGAATGLFVAGLVHLASRSEDVIYDASRKNTTVTFVPLVSSTGKGLAVSFSWR